MKRVDKDILKLAVPSILANITIPLVGMADIAVAGHLAGDSATLIGAVSIGSLLFDLLYWNFVFLRTGTGGMTAQAYGRGDLKAAASTLVRSVSVAFMIALTCLIIQYLFVDLVFLFVKCTPEVKSLAENYFHIRIWAAPAALSLMAIKGWFIGMQDSISPMAADLIVNSVNIACSIILSMGLPAIGFAGVGFIGIAYGTVVAQYTGLIFSLTVILFRYFKKVFSEFNLGDVAGCLKGAEMRKFFSLNSDLFLRSLSIMAIYAGMTVISARYGDLVLAVNSILVQLIMLFSNFTDGFAYAGEALTGKYVGRRNREAVSKTVVAVFKWSMAVAGVFVLIYAFFGKAMLMALTSDVEVVTSAMQYIPWLALMPIFGCAAFTWDGIYTGATASKPIRNSCIYAAAGFLAVWFISWGIMKTAIAENPAMTVHILMAAYLVHLIIRVVYESVLYRRSILDVVR